MAQNVTIAIIGLALTIITLLLTFAWRFGVKISEISYEQGRLKERVDLIWQFMFDRGVVELHRRGLASSQSDFQLTARLEDVAPFVIKLHAAYKRWAIEEPDLSDGRLAELFARDFDHEIMRVMCLPHNMSQAECLSYIVLACKAEGKKDG